MDGETKNTLGELEFYLKAHSGLPIEKQSHPYGECKHFRVLLDGQKHSVTCRDCKKELDPFWYLSLLAKEWSSRRYTDVEAIKAYRELKEQREKYVEKGRICIHPTEGIGMNVWDTYTALYEVEPHYIYRRGNQYYAVNGKGGHENFEYLKMRLAYKQRGITDE